VQGYPVIGLELKLPLDQYKLLRGKHY